MQILFVDQSMIVVSKPPGLLSVPGRGPEKVVCAQTYLEAEFGKTLVVHRLDMDTSGVMLFARHKTAQANLSKQFELRAERKTYEAVNAGLLQENFGTISLSIAKFSLDRPNRHIDPEGQEAVTEFWKLAHSVQTSRVSLMPKT